MGKVGILANLGELRAVRLEPDPLVRIGAGSNHPWRFRHGVIENGDESLRLKGFRSSRAFGLFRASRPRQWSKNALLFIGVIFALKLTDPHSVARALAGFIIFCGVSSGSYLINDLLDLTSDQAHPVKRHRPLASGQISSRLAIISAVALLGGGILASLPLGKTFTALTLAYALLVFAYSSRLKHVVLLDVLVLSAGFVLRAAAGAVVVGVPISPWLYLCTILAALIAALGKRRHEIVLLQENAGLHRRILADYSVALLDQLIVIVVASTIMAYSLYTFFADNLPTNHAMMLTIPFVLYGLFRYLYLIHQRGLGGTPEELLLIDRPLLVCALGWMLAAGIVLYGLPHP